MLFVGDLVILASVFGAQSLVWAASAELSTMDM